MAKLQLYLVVDLYSLVALIKCFVIKYNSIKIQDGNDDMSHIYWINRAYNKVQK